MMKKQLSGFVDVYASVKDGRMSIVEFVDWLETYYVKKKVLVRCSHSNHIGNCKNCKIKKRMELRK
jgi:hypothetical protein